MSVFHLNDPQFLTPTQVSTQRNEKYKRFVTVICGVTVFVVYRRTLPSHPRFIPVHHKPLQLSEHPTVLLLYARDCAPFMEAVAQLRCLMRRLYNCQVTGIPC